MNAHHWNHPHYGQHMKLDDTQWIKTPCCHRMEPANQIYDISMIPDEDKPIVYNHQNQWACVTCVNHAILNLKRTTFGRLARHMNAPQTEIDAYDVHDRSCGHKSINLD